MFGANGPSNSAYGVTASGAPYYWNPIVASFEDITLDLGIATTSGIDLQNCVAASIKNLSFVSLTADTAQSSQFGYRGPGPGNFPGPNDIQDCYWFGMYTCAVCSEHTVGYGLNQMFYSVNGVKVGVGAHLVSFQQLMAENIANTIVPIGAGCCPIDIVLDSEQDTSGQWFGYTVNDPSNLLTGTVGCTTITTTAAWAPSRKTGAQT